jgi:MHS family proline/betaine transporter-like MFS transporter
MNTLQKLIPGVIGNVLEWYEFSLYSFFSTAIAQTFFPSQDKTIALMSAYAVLAVGYIMRPLGSIIFGYLGDRHGRKKIMPFSVALMASATTFMALLPGYQQIGLFAPICLILLRLLQGLALGGEYASSSVYIIEHSPLKHRGFYGSFGLAGVYFGLSLGSMVAAGVNHLGEHSSYAAHIWRLPFLFGFVLGLVGYYIRKRMPETREFLELQTKQDILPNPVKTLFLEEWRYVLLGIGLTLMPAVTSWFVMGFGVSYLYQYGHLTHQQSLQIVSSATVLSFMAIPLFGALSDKLGRRLVLAIPPLLLVCFSLSLGRALLSGHYYTALMALVAFSLCSCALESLVAVTLSELFAANRRCTAMAVAINIANGVFGGTAPLVCLFLIKHWTIEAPLYYLITVASISTCCALAIRKAFLNRTQKPYDHQQSGIPFSSSV